MKGPSKTDNIYAGQRQQRWTPIAAAPATAATHTIVAASSGNEHVLKDLAIAKNGTGNLTVTIALGDTSWAINMDDSVRREFSLSSVLRDEWFCGNNKAITVQLSAAISCTVMGRYATVQYVA